MFSVWDSRRNYRRPVSSPGGPHKIRQHQVDRFEWPTTLVKDKRPIEKRGVAKSGRRSKNTAGILRYGNDDILCLHCGRPGDDPECGFHCYRDFRSSVLTAEALVDVIEVGEFGCGAFTKPWARIHRNQWLDEYFGMLRPLDGEYKDSRYAFEIREECIIDAGPAGNWTRFMNSHCRPNITAEPTFVGKRRCIMFRALKDIGPGEELVFNYGKKYFELIGVQCQCSACRRARYKCKAKA